MAGDTGESISSMCLDTTVPLSSALGIKVHVVVQDRVEARAIHDLIVPAPTNKPEMNPILTFTEHSIAPLFVSVRIEISKITCTTQAGRWAY